MSVLNMHFMCVSVCKVHAFLGPVCDYSVAPVARYSPYWNKPVLSAGAMARDFGDKKREEYGLLTRVGGVTFDSLIHALIAVIEHHRWNNTVKVLASRHTNLILFTYLLTHLLVHTLVCSAVIISRVARHLSRDGRMLLLLGLPSNAVW